MKRSHGDAKTSSLGRWKHNFVIYSDGEFCGYLSLGEITRICVLDKLHLKFLLDIQVEILSRQLDSKVWGSEDRSKMKLELSGSSVLR